MRQFLIVSVPDGPDAWELFRADERTRPFLRSEILLNDRLGAFGRAVLHPLSSKARTVPVWSAAIMESNGAGGRPFFVRTLADLAAFGDGTVNLLYLTTPPTADRLIVRDAKNPRA